MSGKLYGLYTAPEDGLEPCAAVCKASLTAFFESGVTYDCFLYPYFDSLLMSEFAVEYGLLLGTHALLWDEDGRLESAGLKAIDCDYRAISTFLRRGRYIPKPDELLLGGWEQLITGSQRPWSLREQSRRFCSFCEHIARMDGVSVHGLTGGYVAASLSDSAQLPAIKRIYAAKTGGECRVLRPAKERA